MHFFVKYFLMFLFFSSVGWLMESLYCSIGAQMKSEDKKFHFINRGFLSGPITPIYGVSCMVMAATLTPFQNSWILLFVLGLVVCDVVEYFTSYIMEKLFNARWWDYTGYLLNIKGRICLRNSLIWGVLSIVFMKGIYPGVTWIFDKLLDSIAWEGMIALAFMLLGVFAVDLERTVVASLSIHDLIKKADSVRNSMIEVGDRFKEASEERREERREEFQQNYVDDLRSSISQMTGWRRYRVKRMTKTYPKMLNYFNEARVEMAQQQDLASVLLELRFLQMDVEAFFNHEKNEMY